MRRGTGIKRISTVYYFSHFLKLLHFSFISYWNTMILTWNETFYSFQCMFLYFEILELRHFKSWHIKREVLWFYYDFENANFFSKRMLTLPSSWVLLVGLWFVCCCMGFGFGFEKAQIICTVILGKYKAVIKATEAISTCIFIYPNPQDHTTGASCLGEVMSKITNAENQDSSY